MKHINSDGTIGWTDETSWSGDTHRDDAPAMIFASGRTAWFNHAVCFRDIKDGPAGLNPNGDYIWVPAQHLTTKREKIL